MCSDYKSKTKQMRTPQTIKFLASNEKVLKFTNYQEKCSEDYNKLSPPISRAGYYQKDEIHVSVRWRETQMLYISYGNV